MPDLQQQQQQQPIEAIMANALRRISYPDYKASEDFPLWLNGYREKVCLAFGFNQNQQDEVNAEVIKSISGKLTSGTALDTYNRLSPNTKDDYERLIETLTNEFLDPQEKDRFNENFGYNKRKKGQSLKDFMQEIIKDQNRYSSMPEYVTINNTRVKNATKIKDGIRRFRKGIRNRKGQKDRGQQEHMRYNLHKDEDLTWENALEVACRWEAAHDVATSSSSDSESSSSEDQLEVVEAKKNKKKEKKKGKSKKKSSSIATVEEVGAIATLVDKVETNAREIKGVKSEQERLAANVTTWKNETSSTLNEILQAVKQPQLPQQQRYGSMPSQQYQNGNNFGNRNFQRPSNFTWKGRMNQNQQTGFRYNRSTPTQFQRPLQPSAPSTSAATPASNAVASVEEVDPAAQLLNGDGEEAAATVTIPMEQFFELAQRAGQEVDESDIVASLAELNFG